MTTFIDVTGEALASLRSRPVRALLMAVGPLLGVAVIVGSLGVIQSTSGELRAALERLGSRLVVVSAAAGEDARLPAEALRRVQSVPTVDGVAPIEPVSGVTVTAAAPDQTAAPPIANGVWSGGSDLLSVLEIEVAAGRPLGPADEAHGTTAAVVGASVGGALGVDPGTTNTVYVGDYPFAVVGVLERSLLQPSVDFAVLIPESTAVRLFGANTRPSELVVKVDEGAVRETASILPTVVTYGGPGTPAVQVPADLLAAEAAIDQTLAGAIVGLGLLAMLIGGFGIANVMLMSVLERRREIGVRRALGHVRLVVAGQFVAEAGIVGLSGSIGGALVASVIVVAVANVQGWLVVLEPAIMLSAIAAGTVVTLLAGLYPAWRAARLEPLEALRSQ